ncbi:hypothetical protein SDC9_143150 [bioreactor metagenome]|uniref:Uncharacterized protein n=1 Tax=bioreactor metagenome TaxID=1076179 RepID=A0A645E2H4_9ZZZZ
MNYGFWVKQTEKFCIGVTYQNHNAKIFNAAACRASTAADKHEDEKQKLSKYWPQLIIRGDKTCSGDNTYNLKGCITQCVEDVAVNIFYQK